MQQSIAETIAANVLQSLEFQQVASAMSDGSVVCFVVLLLMSAFSLALA